MFDLRFESLEGFPIRVRFFHGLILSGLRHSQSFVLALRPNDLCAARQTQNVSSHDPPPNASPDREQVWGRAHFRFEQADETGMSALGPPGTESRLQAAEA